MVSETTSRVLAEGHTRCPWTSLPLLEVLEARSEDERPGGSARRAATIGNEEGRQRAPNLIAEAPRAAQNRPHENPGCRRLDKHGSIDLISYQNGGKAPRRSPARSRERE